MRPTRRGYMITLICLTAFSAGIMYGPRALDAVVIPGVVALLASIIDVGRVSEPSIERTLPPPAEPGTKAQITLTIEADRPVPVKAIDTVPSGLTGTSVIETIADGTNVEYELNRRDRGCHVIGPVTVRLRDRLGLFERVFVIDNTDSITVFPDMYPLTPIAVDAVQNTAAPTAGAQRGSFEGLQEYTRGDALRDVHWKASARYDELFTRDFGSAASENNQIDALTITINIGRQDRVPSEFVDAAATAAASICVEALSRGAAIQLQTATESVTAVAGSEHSVLEYLAELSVSSTSQNTITNADIHVTASTESVSVSFGEHTVDFVDLLSIENVESQDNEAVSIAANMIDNPKAQTLDHNHDSNITVDTDAYSDVRSESSNISSEPPSDDSKTQSKYT
ncbi:DUF58 domain-containing protein [Haloquadratum walsbyi]|jgi:Uncharacterized conserved protein (some members contain a von Willebrand factor type A (vWA) domain)|uniref:Conserved repeat domain protein n=1 Tax=Haloquadratum walsbyi J07HQW2 TaxID=1238425 RepID=U1PNZ7_9EURY|nr:DUF58 domain-containing protein [Haloquadratum walsbyi]ERG95452.1 MAG: conserved repeat domain protein [Haloquadratum walsbyi J07HQW2]